jgi:hypothetical protein
MKNIKYWMMLVILFWYSFAQAHEYPPYYVHPIIQMSFAHTTLQNNTPSNQPNSYHTNSFDSIRQEQIAQARLQAQAHAHIAYINRINTYHHALHQVKREIDQFHRGNDTCCTWADTQLINKICHDNPHLDAKTLHNQLLMNPCFNLAACLPEFAGASYAMPRDVYINPEHFNNSLLADMRLHALQTLYKPRLIQQQQ